MPRYENSPSSSYDKWVPIVLWLALLAGLLYTSVSGTALAMGGSITNLMQSQLSLEQTGENQRGMTTLEIVNLALMAVLLSQVVNAWLKFVSLTDELIVAYAGASTFEGQKTLFSHLLVFDPSLGLEAQEGGDFEEAELDPEDAHGTLVGDVIRPLAFTWAIIIGASAASSIAMGLFG